MSDQNVFRLSPNQYVHILDNNSNVTRLVAGPCVYTRQDHERLVGSIQQKITIPPRHYCRIANPCVRAEDGTIVKESSGQVKLRHGDVEFRMEQEPFCLEPGEELFSAVQELEVVAPNSALKVLCNRDFTDSNGTKRIAGDQWLFRGPATYTPVVEEEITQRVKASLIQHNQALKIRAKQAFSDRSGVTRKAGEMWLIRDAGAFLPDVYEEVVERVNAHVLTDKTAVHLRAIHSFTDVFGKERKAGEEWLITLEDCETHIPDVYEEVVGPVEITTLTDREYCVVLDPVDAETGKPQYGKSHLRTGDQCFFLKPGEHLRNGIEDVYVLGEDEALLLRAVQDHAESDGTERCAGDRWMVYGPREYIPDTRIEVLETRRSIPLDENEGIYVRDIQTGAVKAHIGQTYMLKPNEVLWEKELPPIVDKLIADIDPVVDRTAAAQASKAGSLGLSRDKTRVVSLKAPHNTAVQIYDYKSKRARVVFGPDLISLMPDEQFTVMNLSGGKPKKPNCIKSLVLLLGPDFMTDIVQVETSDHARLSLQLSYNWHFDVDKSSREDAAKIFQVPDFVGDACKAIASRVRGAVASTAFDDFHKNSARIIRSAVFGLDEQDKIRDAFRFDSNNLVLTNIDIQTVEPVDQRTRDSLQKSVQLAIEITTNSQEASARHDALRIEQEAKGRLERQKIQDEAAAEKARKDLLVIQAESMAVESQGQATAEAKARAQAAEIEGQADVKQAELKAESRRIELEVELEQTQKKQEAEIAHQRALYELEIKRARELAEVESQKFKEQVDAIGADTIQAMAQAGPEMQAKLLQGLGLNSLMITDGKSPINLFNTAKGLVAQPGGSQE